MKATLFGVGVFPPPAAGADVFAGGDGAGAGGAADARVKAVVQRVVRDLVELEVGPHLLFAPVRERVEFCKAVAIVEGADRQSFASRRLLRAQSGDPGLLAGQRALQWFDLARMPSTRQDFRGVNIGLYVNDAP